MAVDRTSQGYGWPVWGFRRFSVRQTAAFSWALPTKRMPSSPVNRARCWAITASLRWPFSKAISGGACSATNASIAATNALLIGAMSAEDANSWPRCERKNAATPLSYWSPGTYTFRYIRSMLWTSSVVWSRRISPTVRGRLMAGSGRWGSLVDLLPARRAHEQGRLYRIPLSHGRGHLLVPSRARSHADTTRRSEAEPR